MGRRKVLGVQFPQHLATSTLLGEFPQQLVAIGGEALGATVKRERLVHLLSEHCPVSIVHVEGILIQMQGLEAHGDSPVDDQEQGKCPQTP